MQIILALDVGSSSIRCSAYRLLDTESTRVEALKGCCTQRKIRSVRPATGQIALQSQDNALSLLEEIDSSVDETLRLLHENIQGGFHVVGLGFSTFVMNLVAVDEQGNVVAEEATMTYACNTPQVAVECRNIRSDYSSEQLRNLYQATGAPLHSAYAPAQLRSLYHRKPEITQKIHKWQTLATICLSRWRGRTIGPISYSEASWTGLLNFRSCRWDLDALMLLPDECLQALPELVDYSESVVGIPIKIESTQQDNPYWTRWPDLQDSCHFFYGLGDGACANIGSKCSTPSRIAVTIGTSAAARVVLPLRKSSKSNSPRASQSNGFSVPSGLWCYRLDKSHVVLGGALTDGGSVVEWAREFLNLKDESFDECMKEVEAMMANTSVENHAEPGVSGTRLTVIPFLSGERSTGYRASANGCVMGLTRETTTAMFLKACLESVMIRVNAVVQLVKGCIVPVDGAQQPSLVASGAALEHNEHWRQMLADATGVQVLMDDGSLEGTSRGVACMVALVLSKPESQDSSQGMHEEAISSPTVSTPNLSATDGYWARAAKEQKDLIDAVSPLW